VSLILTPLYGGFNTISDLKKYAASYPEIVKSDNNNWIDPEYTSFYKKYFKPNLVTRMINKIFRFFGIPISSEWDSGEFKNLLITQTKKRNEKKIKKSFLKNVVFAKGKRVFIWGDLHGAFHSFVRDLSSLKKLGVISEDLVIREKNANFVFIGDVVSRSPFSLETLHVILQLMNKNHDKVIFLKGHHETREYWQGFSMRRALKWRFGVEFDATGKTVPLENEINKFFVTIPGALLIEQKESGEKIYCSYKKIASDILEDKKLRLILHGEERLGVLRRFRGLSFVGYLANATQWSLLSCPTEIYQNFFKFHYDSFIELSIGDSVAESILTLHDRDVNKKEDFGQTHYNPVFGYKLREKKNVLKDKEIVNIGCTLSLSGVTGPLGRETKSGIEAALSRFNKEDGKILLKPIVFDDGYSPRKASMNIKKLLNKYGMDFVLTPTGTPTLSFYLDMVKENKIAVFFPYTGAPQFRKSDINSIVHFRASYEQEVEKSIEFLIKNHGIRSFAFFYQDDPYGAPIAKAAHKVLEKNGIDKWLDLPHHRTQSDFTKIVKKIKEVIPNAIGCFSSHFPTIEFIDQLGAGYFLRRILFGISFLYSEAFGKHVRDLGIKSVISSVVPEGDFDDMEIAKEHKRTMKEFGRFATSNSFEGYIAASLLIDAIKNIDFQIQRINAYI
jgi:ABC-type branched-subunit amino acid transport system substrate-binding protein